MSCSVSKEIVKRQLFPLFILGPNGRVSVWVFCPRVNVAFSILVVFVIVFFRKENCKEYSKISLLSSCTKRQDESNIVAVFVWRSCAAMFVHQHYCWLSPSSVHLTENSMSQSICFVRDAIWHNRDTSCNGNVLHSMARLRIRNSFHFWVDKHNPVFEKIKFKWNIWFRMPTEWGG